MNVDIEKVLITEEELKKIVETLSEKINGDYKGEQLLFVPILKGSIVFASDLFRKIEGDAFLDFIQCGSYGAGTVSSGKIEIKRDVERSVEGKNVLIVEDVVDSGNTLHALTELFEKRNAKSVRICSLLDKPSRRMINVKVDYVGKTIPDEFVVGYGLDFDGKYRNLPYVGILKREVYVGK